MFRASLLFLCLSTAAIASSSTSTDGDDTTVLIESFEQGHSIHTWKVMNDPVMGGKSKGSFRITADAALFQGEVVDVPFLHAPGFLQARTIDHATTAFPDVSHCTGLQVTARSHTDYTGYRLSFGTAHAPHGKRFAFGYKTDMRISPSSTQHESSSWSDIVLPFSAFTDYWDDATGDAIVTCEQDSSYCPDNATLRNMRVVAIWAEGVEGRVDLEIKAIRAVGCYSGKAEEQQQQSKKRNLPQKPTL